MDELRNFYAGKRVFITGHTGFKGTWLTQVMILSGATVAGFSLPKSHLNSHFERLNLKGKITHYAGDIRDANALLSAISEFKPDVVFHLAAQALVKLAYASPSDTFETNVMGSLYLLEAVQACPSIKSLVYVTSDKCYENVEWIWGYKETDTLGGRDPYSASKACAELVFSSFTRSFFSERHSLGFASVRAGNVIGGGDYSADRIVPDCIRAIRENRPIELRNPESTRPWQHVLEPLSGYIALAEKLYAHPEHYSESWNFGPLGSDVRNVGSVAQTIVDIYGKGSVAKNSIKSDFHEANLLQLNCDLANRKLGWSPRWSVNRTLEMTALWYRSVDEGKVMLEITNGQINEYFNLGHG